MMGAIVLFDPEMVNRRQVKAVDEAELEPMTQSDWDAVGFIQGDDGYRRFILSRRPKRSALEAAIRLGYAKAFAAGATATRDAVRDKKKLDPVESGEAYARTADIPEV
jgi:hypothetical protein